MNGKSTVSRAMLGSAFAFLLVTTGAGAQSDCANPRDTTALKTADMQQFLMVAALTCGKIAAYNGFVTSHQRELQESDAVLLRFFMARNARTGDADYNAYKTALANAASLRNIHDPQFCAAAETAFAAAGDRTVAELVNAVAPPIKLEYASCEVPAGRPLRREASLTGR